MDDAARLPLEAWYFDVPIVTRAFITASVLTSIAVVLSNGMTISNAKQCDVVSLYQLFYSWRAAFVKAQVPKFEI
jgi:Derlin-2/3